MTTPIATFEDILAAMENNPHLQEAMRQHVLGKEFLRLPAMVQELGEAITRLTESVNDYIITTNARLDRLEQDVSELKGHSVPVAAHRIVGALAEAVNVRRPRWLDNTDIVDIADDAEDEGRADIPENELKSFKAIDLAITAVDKATRQNCYVVIECSYTLTRDDVTRSKRNAEHMTRFTGVTAKAVVAGNHIPELVTEFARDQNVACVQITSKASSPR